MSTTGARPALTSEALYAASNFIHEECAALNSAFMKCKSEDANPASCLDKGSAVTSCVHEVEARLRTKCKTEWTAYAQCLWQNNNEFSECRAQQEALEVAYAALKGEGK